MTSAVMKEIVFQYRAKHRNWKDPVPSLLPGGSLHLDHRHFDEIVPRCKDGVPAAFTTMDSGPRWGFPDRTMEPGIHGKISYSLWKHLIGNAGKAANVPCDERVLDHPRYGLCLTMSFDADMDRHQWNRFSDGLGGLSSGAFAERFADSIGSIIEGMVDGVGMVSGGEEDDEKVEKSKRTAEDEAGKPEADGEMVELVQSVDPTWYPFYAVAGRADQPGKIHGNFPFFATTATMAQRILAEAIDEFFGQRYGIVDPAEWFKQVVGVDIGKVFDANIYTGGLRLLGAIKPGQGPDSRYLPFAADGSLESSPSFDRFHQFRIRPNPEHFDYHRVSLELSTRMGDIVHHRPKTRLTPEQDKAVLALLEHCKKSTPLGASYNLVPCGSRHMRDGAIFVPLDHRGRPCSNGKNHAKSKTYMLVTRRGASVHCSDADCWKGGKSETVKIPPDLDLKFPTGMTCAEEEAVKGGVESARKQIGSYIRGLSQFCGYLRRMTELGVSSVNFDAVGHCFKCHGAQLRGFVFYGGISLYCHACGLLNKDPIRNMTTRKLKDVVTGMCKVKADAVTCVKVPSETLVRDLTPLGGEELARALSSAPVRRGVCNGTTFWVAGPEKGWTVRLEQGKLFMLHHRSGECKEVVTSAGLGLAEIAVEFRADESMREIVQKICPELSDEAGLIMVGAAIERGSDESFCDLRGQCHLLRRACTLHKESRLAGRFPSRDWTGVR
ncbi:hypothetical protein DFJ74DRAFT_508915 [Hyaloraphidium curvatum]|nr:hypothetical protein DFJ74DRAFT_508915 [Hyaloraphidium curvatum]